MRLNVHVHGLHFVVPCGEGAQTFKWLGLVVAQRYALAVPHGRCRTREDAHLKPGFFLPASIAKTQSGQVLHPSKRISEVCKDNDNITVQLQQEVTVNEIGAPQFSAWAVSAFSTPARGSAVDPLLALGAGAKSSSPTSEAKSTTAAVAKADHKSAPSESNDEIKQYARSEILQQVNSGQFQTEMEFEAAFMYDWSRLRMDELEKDPKEREGIQELLLAHFSPINAAYMHYAVGSGETAYGMNGHELAHFFHECGLYDYRQDHTAIDKIFSTCLRHDAFISIVDRASLTRVGFLHALLRALLYSPRTAVSGPSKDVIEKKLKENVLPAVIRLTTGPFRDHTHNDKIVAIFQEARAKLLKLYARYAEEHADKPSRRDAVEPGWPLLLSATGLKSVLYDCGVFCVGDTKAHEEIFDKAVEQCFLGMREVRSPDEQFVVFSEFMEVVARVGMSVLSDNDLPTKDAIKITLDALRTLPIKASTAAQRK